MPDWEMSEEFLNSAKSWIIKYGGGISLVLIVVWPLATLPFGVFPKVRLMHARTLPLALPSPSPPNAAL